MSVKPRERGVIENEVAVDAHVHLHEPARDLAALEAAVRNFAACCPVASRLGVLMLAEMNGEDAFSRLGALTRANATSEATSLWFSVGGWRLLAVAGRQVVTAERLEVLALATRSRFDDGMPLASLLDALEAEDAIAVLPWGCGKWLGARGRLVAHAVSRAQPGRLFLGDNSGRPAMWPVSLFGAARARRLDVLPGSDPLPLDGEWQRIGRFGFTLRAALSESTPAADLKAALRDPQASLRRYGKLEAPARFVRNQLRLRLRSRAAHANWPRA